MRTPPPDPACTALVTPCAVQGVSAVSAHIDRCREAMREPFCSSVVSAAISLGAGCRLQNMGNHIMQKRRIVINWPPVQLITIRRFLSPRIISVALDH